MEKENKKNTKSQKTRPLKKEETLKAKTQNQKQPKKVSLNKESQSQIKLYSKITYIIAKILKICTIIITILLTILLCLSIFILANIKIDNNRIDLFESTISYKISDEKVSLSYDNEIIIDEKLNSQNINNLKLIIEKIETEKANIAASIVVSFTGTIMILVCATLVLKHIDNLFYKINKEDTPFTYNNKEHLNDIARLIITIVIINAATKILTSMFLKIPVSSFIEVRALYCALICFTLSYVFEYGYEMQKDSNCIIYNKDK